MPIQHARALFLALTTAAACSGCAAPPADRPTCPTLAIGAGYEIAATGAAPESAAPNTAAVRLRLASGLAVEPRLILSRATLELFGDESTRTSLGASTTLRIPIASRGKTDLLALGAVAFARESVEADPDEDPAITTTFALGWGLAIDHWLSPSWTASMSFLNPIATYVAQDDNGDPEQVTYGAILAPTVLAMAHLHY